MIRKILPFVVLLCGLLWNTAAHASHFRYGNISWKLPDPQNGPKTVVFTVTTAWSTNSPSPTTTTLNYGDGGQNPATTGPLIGTGTDAVGQQYNVYQYTATHTYVANGPFIAFFEGPTKRIPSPPLVNGGGKSFRVDTQVSLAPGNTAGPVASSVPLIQQQIGNVRTYFFPYFDADGDTVACRFATTGEMWSQNIAADGAPPPASENIPAVPAGGAIPTLVSGANGCTMTWNLTQALATEEYVVHLIFESTHGGQVSSTAIDLIDEMVLPPPPACAGSGTFVVNVGQVFSTMTTGTHNIVTPLTASVINAPVGSTLSLPLVGPSPLTNTFSWTPVAANAGTATIVIVNYTDTVGAGTLTGSCFLTIQVPECANYGAPCSAGVGACLKTGTNVCAGPNLTVCSAVAGQPTAEICDTIDNDCDGTPDDGLNGAACATGLPGVCASGVGSCVAGVGSCVPMTMPGMLTEKCNGLDDDCDGTNDDGFNVGMACSNGVGACLVAGTFACSGVDATACNAVPGEPAPEICGNAIDEDCDGMLDTGCLDTDGDGLPDAVEVLIGTNPNDPDSDDDGVPDGQEPSPGVDTDGDGLINALDPDSDNDGLFDGTEMGLGCNGAGTDKSKNLCIPDGDGGATITDPLDPDTDDGGVSDGSEDTNRNGVVDAGETNPGSGHGPDDNGVVDTDGDGLSDGLENAIGSNPNDADTDDDGVIDGLEPNPTADMDGDGLIDVLDPDSDNDGLFDGTEMGLDCNDPATDNSKGFCIPDADPGTTTSPLDPDTDHGGVKDGSEDPNRNGKIDPGETDPTPGHGADDSQNVDTDGDGLSDAFENAIGSNPNDKDTDDDGLLDGQEPNPAADMDGDGLIDVLDPDSDDDGLFDGTEAGKDCGNADTDASKHRCIADADPATTTSPVDPDTDNGGVKDGSEDFNRNGKLDAGEADPTAGHGGDDAGVVDSDGDGLSDGLENAIGSNPNDQDTDDDGVIDGQEPNPTLDMDGDGLIDVLDCDSDNDGLFDGTEMNRDCSNKDTDASKKHCVPDADPSSHTSPVDPDTDDGGVTDGSEDSNLNGKLDAGEADPTAGHGGDDAGVVDTDKDGLSDGLEMKLGSDPNDADTDDDGVIDGKEANPSADMDGDGKIDVLDPDSDGDGLFDGTEVGNDCGNPATDNSKKNCIADADPTTTTGPLDPDTDHGGVKDGVEDANHNGKVDAGETDPNVKMDDKVGCQMDSECGDKTSGKVCDSATRTCIDGCRGMGGNGCPSGLECTSMDTTIGMCVNGAGGAGPGTGTGTGGAGTGGGATDGITAVGHGVLCSARPGAGGGGGEAWLVGGALAALAGLRRRRRG